MENWKLEMNVREGARERGRKKRLNSYCTALCDRIPNVRGS